MIKGEVEKYVEDHFPFNTDMLNELSLDDAYKVSQALVIKADKIRAEYGMKVVVNKMNK